MSNLQIPAFAGMTDPNSRGYRYAFRLKPLITRVEWETPLRAQAAPHQGKPRFRHDCFQGTAQLPWRLYFNAAGSCLNIRRRNLPYFSRAHRGSAQSRRGCRSSAAPRENAAHQEGIWHNCTVQPSPGSASVCRKNALPFRWRLPTLCRF